MKTIWIKAFMIDELSDKAKQRARDWWRINGIDDDWSYATIEEAVREGEFMGIEFSSKGNRQAIWWSGFSSQGDGACFEGSWSPSAVKADKVAEGWGDDPATTEIKRIAAGLAEIAKKFPHSHFKVRHSGHYYHEYCTEFDFESGADDTEGDELDNWRTPEDDENDPDTLPRHRMAEDFPEEELTTLARDFMRWIYRQLNKDYDYQNEDEQVDEVLRLNEYLFTESGSRTAVL